MAKARLCIIGCGQRGHAYAQFYRTDPDNHFDVVAIAEPNSQRAQAFALRYGVPTQNVFQSYQDFSRAEHTAEVDAILICVQDSQHLECVTMFAGRYHILCEKPMAATQLDCKIMQDILQKRQQKLFGMGHVLRYSPHNIVLRDLLTQGVIGTIIAIDHTEPVGHAHFAHSYVRGNWRRQNLSSFSLLTKCCHDMFVVLLVHIDDRDLIQWLIGSASGTSVRPNKITSMGSLSHFVKKNKPTLAGNAVKCLDCAYEVQCPYSAKKIYLDNFLSHGELYGFQRALSDSHDLAGITKALQDTRYGTCVYECDNDVCDNQTVLLQYDTPQGIVQATLHMIAFSQAQCIRKTTIYGSHGEIRANGHDSITVHNFATGEETIHAVTDEFGGDDKSHAGGDHGLILQFTRAIRQIRDHGMDIAQAQQQFIGCTIDDICSSHEIVFQAEESRLAW